MTEGMRFIAGAEFTMGSGRFHPEEAPCRRIWVDDFWIDETLVTNREFAVFVAETGRIGRKVLKCGSHHAPRTIASAFALLPGIRK